MKKLFLSCITLLFACSLLLGTTAAQSPLPQNRETVTERAYRTRLGRIDTIEQSSRLTSLKTRLTAARLKASQDWAVDLLGHIEILVNQTLADITKSTIGTISTQQPPSTAQQFVNKSPKPYYPNFEHIIRNYDEGTRVYEGGDKGALISRYQFIAQREPFWVEEITITANKSFDSTISKVTLIDENGVIIGSGSPSGSNIVIRGIKYLLEQGQTDFYVLADFHTMGYGLTGPDTTNLRLSVKITDAKGYWSGDDRSTTTETGDTVIITPLKITDYGFERSFQGYVVDTYINENAENTLGIITFTAGENENRKITQPVDAEVSLDRIALTVSTNLTGLAKTQLLESLTLQRVDSSFGSTDGVVQGDTVIFSPSQQSNAFARIEQGEQAGRRIRGTLPSAPGRTSVKLSIQNLGNGGVIYSAEGSSTPVTILDGGSYEISGPRLYEIN